MGHNPLRALAVPFSPRLGQFRPGSGVLTSPGRITLPPQECCSACLAVVSVRWCWRQKLLTGPWISFVNRYRAPIEELSSRKAERKYQIPLLVALSDSACRNTLLEMEDGLKFRE